MDYTQETSASAAIKALQHQLKEFRSENNKLQSQIHELQTLKSSDKENYDKHIEDLRTEYTNKENSMKEDLIYVCQRLKHLEQENSSLVNENYKLKEKILEFKQTERMVYLLQEELQIMNRKLQQKEKEEELSNKRIAQLESKESFEKTAKTTGFDALKSGVFEKNAMETRAEFLDAEIAKKKTVYRECLKNPNPGNLD